jgi:hypothetical protein
VDRGALLAVFEQFEERERFLQFVNPTRRASSTWSWLGRSIGWGARFTISLACCPNSTP